MADILLIEDDLKLRVQIETLLKSKGHEVQTAVEGSEGLKHLAALGADCIVLDTALPDISGMEILKRISQQYPNHPPVILITNQASKTLAIEALRLGAFDFLEKPFHPETLAQAIKKGLEQKHQEIVVFRAFIANTSSHALTPRESEIASFVALGLTNEQIAEKLSIGSETVKTHLKNIFKKLGVENRTHLSSYFRKSS